MPLPHTPVLDRQPEPIATGLDRQPKPIAIGLARHLKPIATGRPSLGVFLPNELGQFFISLHLSNSAILILGLLRLFVVIKVFLQLKALGMQLAPSRQKGS